MSSFPPGPGGRPPGSTGPGSSSPGNPRRASLTFRSQTEQDRDGLDPANQSLAEALGLVSKVLNVAMLAVAAVFVLSGLNSIRENEVGIRLLFGKVTGDRLPPGFQFSYPYPLGEMIKVDTGLVSIDLDETFWPKLGPEQRNLTVQQLAQSPRQLKPGEDGSNITGDQNLAHTRWRVVYQRSEPVAFVRNLLPEEEREIVQAAVARGIVHAVAQVKIDDLLKQSGGETLSVAARARVTAQKHLDAIGSGVEIKDLLMLDKTPPLLAYNDFSGVQSAEQKASQKRADAESTARSRLNETAGEAAGPIITLIDAYEAAIEKNDDKAAEELLVQIRALMDGAEAQVGGEKVRFQTSGRVAAILNEAREYASSIVNRRRGELAAFQSKIQQFRDNPTVVVQREWADAMAAMLGRDNIEQMWLPPGTERIRLMVNRDPQIAREQEKARKEREKREFDERRFKEQQQDRFRTSIDAPMTTR